MDNKLNEQFQLCILKNKQKINLNDLKRKVSFLQFFLSNITSLKLLLVKNLKNKNFEQNYNRDPGGVGLLYNTMYRHLDE